MRKVDDQRDLKAKLHIELKVFRQRRSRQPNALKGFHSEFQYWPNENPDYYLQKKNSKENELT